MLCFRGANARDFKATKRAQGQQGTQGLLCTEYPKGRLAFMHKPNFLGISAALKFRIIVRLLFILRQKKSEVVKISQHSHCGNQHSNVTL